MTCTVVVVISLMFAPALLLAQDGQKDRLVQAEALIDRFEKAASGAERTAAALDISQNYAAKLLLKTSDDLKDLGGAYFDVMKGADGFMDQVRASARQRLTAAGWSHEAVNAMEAIENAVSRAERRAPMDLDEGIKAISTDMRQALRAQLTNRRLPQLRGNRAIAAFTEDAWRAYEGALIEQAAAYGKTVNPVRMGLTVTTPWHAEAYLASEVLKQGGVADLSLIGQTVDVTAFKLDELHGLWLETRSPEALMEMARATLKDLDKVEAAFAQVNSQVGSTLAFSADNRDLIAKLRTMNLQNAEGVVAELKGGATFYQRCRGLVGNMEAAFVMQGPVELLKVRLYQRYLASRDVRLQAIEAILSGTPGPAEATAFDRELSRVAAARLVSLEPQPPEAFIAKLKAQWKASTRLDPADETVAALLNRLDDLSEAELTTLFDTTRARSIVSARVRLAQVASSKARYLQRLTGSGTLGAVEKPTLLLVEAADRAPTGSGDRAMLYGAALVGLASGIAETIEISDRGLGPDAERRAIVEAWARALPMVSDIFSGLNSGAAFLTNRDVVLLGEAALSLTMAAAWLVPPLQIPTLVAMAGSATVKGGWSAYQMHRQRDIIRTWVDSGEWDMATGQLRGILDGRGGVRPVPPDPQAVAAFFDDGDVPYHTTTGLFSTTGTLRASVIDYVNGVGSAGYLHNPQVQASITALKNLYPDFDPLAAIQLRGGEGRKLLDQSVRARGRDGERAALGIYAVFERTYRAAVAEALPLLKDDAEKAFQAEHVLGTAREAIDRLKAIGTRLGLPLLDRVQAIETSVTSVAAEALKTPWEKHDVKVRVIEHIQAYAEGYARVESSLDQIRRAFAANTLTPPSSFNLTGYLIIDEPRMKDLAVAYISGLAQAARDAEAQAALANVRYDPSSACATDVRATLVRLQATRVLANDWALLAAQWSGRAAAASRSRDAEVERARRYVDRNTPLPVEVWRAVALAAESAYAWAHAPEAWAGQDFSNLEATARERQLKAESEYEVAVREAQRRFAAGCQTPKPLSSSEPEAACACYNEWFQTVFAPSRQKWCEASVPSGLEDKCLTLTYTVTTPFTWVPERGFCVGSWTVTQTSRAELTVGSRTKGTVSTAVSQHSNGIYLSEARDTCRKIKLDARGAITTLLPCGGAPR